MLRETRTPHRPDGTAKIIAGLAGGHEIGVPLTGLSKPPTEYPLKDHASAFAAHLVFGVTTEGVRRLVLGVRTRLNQRSV